MLFNSLSIFILYFALFIHFFRSTKSDQNVRYIEKFLLKQSESHIVESTKADNFFKLQYESILKRRKRHNTDDKDIAILKDLESTWEYNFKHSKYVEFFPYEDESELRWFAVEVNNSHLSLYDMKNLSEKNAVFNDTIINDDEKLTINSIDSYTFFSIVKSNRTVMYRLIKHGEYYVLKRIQILETLGEITQIITWRGMQKDEIYLAVGTRKEILIYSWLGFNFDRIDHFNFGCESLLPFENRGIMNIATSGDVTLVFKHNMHTNKFNIVQRLPSSDYVASFDVVENQHKSSDIRHAEYYFSISSSKSTILYKKLLSRYVPFQELPPSRKSIAFGAKNTILLFLLDTENRIIGYQYDGWRFVNSKVSLSAVVDAKKIVVNGEDTLLVRYEDNIIRKLRLKLEPVKTIQVLKSAYDSWCIDISKEEKNLSEFLSLISKPPDRVVIKHGIIDRLRIPNITGLNITFLNNLLIKYKNIESTLNDQKKAVIEKSLEGGVGVTNLNLKNAEIKCRTKCKVHQIVTETENEVIDNLRQFTQRSRRLIFENVVAEKISNYESCPKIKFPLKEIKKINVKNLVNGRTVEELKTETLKINGDQEIAGDHYISNLLTNNIELVHDIVTNKTESELEFSTVRVNKLNVASGAFLLPLNGSECSMHGTITARELNFNKTVNMTGHFDGKLETLNPIKVVYGSLGLKADYDLRNIQIEQILKVDDFSFNGGLSANEYLAKGLSLNDNVSTHIIFLNNSAEFNSIKINSMKWITPYSNEIIRISGAKRVPHNVEFSKNEEYRLRIPTSKRNWCSSNISTENIDFSELLMKYVKTRILQSNNIFDKENPNNTILDGATSFDEIDFSKKMFTGNVTLINATIHDVDGVEHAKLNEFLKRCFNGKMLKGPISMSELSVENLEVMRGFDFLPNILNNATFMKNSNIKYLNNIDIESFMNNSLKVSESLNKTVIFKDKLVTKSIEAQQHPLKFVDFEDYIKSKLKVVVRSLKAESLYVPHNFQYPSPDTICNLIINGSVKFIVEPAITNINGKNLSEIYNTVWLKDRVSRLTGSNVSIRNMSLFGSTNLQGDFKTPFTLPESDLRGKFLSKTQSQDIEHYVVFDHLTCPNIVFKGSFNLTTNDREITQILNDSVMKNGIQTVTSTSEFEMLSIRDNLTLLGYVNGKNLSKDVVRRDAKTNDVTGQKTIGKLSIRDLKCDYLNDILFKNWHDNVLLKDGFGTTVIKGRKGFRVVNFENLRLESTLKGRNLSNALLKSKDQVIGGLKNITTLSCKLVKTDGLINEVNITDLVNSQLKKHKEMQTIRYPMTLVGNLEIFGSITFNEKELRCLKNNRNKINETISKIANIRNSVKAINYALQERSSSLTRLINVTGNIDLNMVEKSNTYTKCWVENSTLSCPGSDIKNLPIETNQKEFLSIQLVNVAAPISILMTVQVNSVYLYAYNRTDSALYILERVHLPYIRRARAHQAGERLWVVVQTHAQMLALRYEPWGIFRSYILPPSNLLVLDKISKNDRYIVLLRSDGIWILEGLGQPKHIHEIHFKAKTVTYSNSSGYFIHMPSVNKTYLLEKYYK